VAELHFLRYMVNSFRHFNQGFRLNVNHGNLRCFEAAASAWKDGPNIWPAGGGDDENWPPAIRGAYPQQLYQKTNSSCLPTGALSRTVQ
jgi:hypothetical protein